MLAYLQPGPRAGKGSPGCYIGKERAVALDGAEPIAAIINSNFSQMEDEFQGNKRQDYNA